MPLKSNFSACGGLLTPTPLSSLPPPQNKALPPNNQHQDPTYEALPTPIHNRLTEPTTHHQTNTKSTIFDFYAFTGFLFWGQD